MIRDSLLLAEQELRSRYVDLDAPIHGMLLATLAEQHILFIGPPGTAKSQLISDYSEYLSGNVFMQLMTRYTTLEEIIGPLSIKGLAERDEYKRITKGKIP